MSKIMECISMTDDKVVDSSHWSLASVAKTIKYEMTLQLNPT